MSEPVLDRLERALQRLRSRTTAAGVDPPRSALVARMAELHVPAVSVAVIADTGVVAAGAWGSADESTLFQAASASKPVTAVGAMSLVREGMLDLDAEVNDLLRRWQLPSGKEVTVRRLLGHAGGLGVHGFPGYPAGSAVPSVVDVLDGVPPANTEAVRVVRPPGAVWQYSGGGYALLQLLLEDVTGSTFHDLMKERVLDPLGMRTSTFEQPLPVDLERLAAPGHDAAGNTVPGRWHTHPEAAAAGLWTTPSELLRVVAEMVEPSAVLYDGLRDMMLTPQTAGGHGLGWMFDGPYLQHGGSNVGYRCQVVGSVDERCGIAVMTNGEAAEPALLTEIVAAVAEEFGWAAYLRERTTVPLSDEQRTRMTGTYTVLPGIDLEISDRGGILTAAVPGLFDGQLFAASNTEFFVTAVDATLTVRGEGLVVVINSMELPCTRVDP